MYFIADCRSFIAKFINTIFKCKPISTVGAEQVGAVQYRLSVLYSKNIARTVCYLEYTVDLFVHAMMNLYHISVL